MHVTSPSSPPHRVFIAGATGVIGRRLVRLLTAEGHEVAGMTRSELGSDWLRAHGATDYRVDAFDRQAVAAAVAAFRPDVLLHQLTDLPDRSDQLPSKRGDNARIRVEGTRNLVDAARASGVGRIIAQSIAWELPPGAGADAVAYLEQAVLGAGGTVLRYGQFYGPGTFYEDALPDHPRIHIDAAAAATIAEISGPPGIRTITEA